MSFLAFGLSVFLPVSLNAQTEHASKSVLVNQDVIELVKAGAAAEMVIGKIKSSVCRFETSPAALRLLKNAGVPDSVIQAMVRAPFHSAAGGAANDVPKTAHVKCGIGASDISLRSTPEGTVTLRKLKCDEEVGVLDFGSPWVKIRTNDGRIGYVSRFFIVEEGAPVVSTAPIFGGSRQRPEQSAPLDLVAPDFHVPSELISIPPRARRGDTGVTPSRQVPPSTVLQDKCKGYGALQMLTPDQGVDFTKYLESVVATVKRNWYAIMPTSALYGEQGRVILQFRIFRDGVVKSPEPYLVESSGKAPLDSAAASAIKSSAPFAKLPPTFSGEYVELRFIYLYNLPCSAAKQ